MKSDMGVAVQLFFVAVRPMTFICNDCCSVSAAWGPSVGGGPSIICLSDWCGINGSAQGEA